ncbi:MAG: heme-binding protein [Hydrogenovibrio sp.]|uniref:GlcG/HbpS family heme-binding protein n=1 Tax=Hydrogenovibrio sp. TaxID=2065821 RepID=UPI002870452D|nr:heme-binding protein [Hydrogenovibrio sp.]MDR9498437.1 heme-binding protein [Hydrogenovibrio sp.]
MKKWWWMALALLGTPAMATDVVTSKTIGLGLANDLAEASVEACRQDGYQVSAVVVDRHGILRTAMRDDLAAKYTLQIAQEKANMTIMSGLKSGQFRQMREDIRQELNHIDGLIVMVGALPIVAGGTTIGAIGVSGAPGGEKDERCAQAALDQFQDRLDFAM